MPILVVSTVHPPNDVRIVDKQAASLASHLSKPVQAHFWRTFFDEKGDFEYQGVQISIHDRNTKFKSRLIRKFSDLFSAAKVTLASKEAVIIIHDPELVPLGCLFKFLGRKVIYDAHEDLPMQLAGRFGAESLLGRVGKWFGLALVRAADFSMDGVMGATPQILERFRKAPVHLVRNFPMLSEFDEAAAFESRQEAKVCYVGGLTRLRGVKEMVLAINQVANSKVELHLAGRWESREFREECLAEDKQGRVIDHGVLGRREVCNLLQDSILGLVVLYPTTAYKEALPVKMFEYMAAGVAVIGADFPVIESILSEENCGVAVPSQDVEALSLAITERLKDLEGTRMMGEAGRRAVEEQYSWEAEKQQFVKFVNSYFSDSGEHG